MRQRTITLFIGLASLLAGFALAAEITVHGTGVVWTEPDQARIELGYTGVGADVGGAIAQGDAVVLAVRDALAAEGIDPLDVRTTGYTVWRDERWDESGEPRLAGYRVHHGLHVLLRDVEQLGRVIEAATDAGANQIGGIAFGVADASALETEARAAAFAAARARAAELAGLAGVSLGDVTVVEEVDRTAWGPANYAMDGRGGEASIAAGRSAVEVVLRVTFATEE